MDKIMKIFNSEDEKEIKQSFKDILINHFKEDLESMDVYLFNPYKIEDIVTEMLEELVEELKQEYRDKLKELMDKKFEIMMKNFR